MTDTNAHWIETNLQRQRKILEEKQKKKRHQSAGSVRTALAPSTTLNSLNDFQIFDNTPLLAPAHSSSHIPQDYLPTSSSPPPPLPRGITSSQPRTMMMQSVSSLSTPATRHDDVDDDDAKAAVSQATNGMHRPVHDFGEHVVDLSAKMRRVNLESVVVSDDEEDGANSNTSSPWNNTHAITEKIPGDGPPDYHYIKNNSAKFVEDPVAPNTLYKCVISRQKNGLDRGMYPTYYLHLEDPERQQRIFLLAARKRKKSATANYLISTDPTKLSRDADGYCAKVRSNALGTQFVVYDSGQNPKNASDQLGIRQELVAVIYETNVLGFKGPRKMTVILPGIEPGTEKKPGVRVVIRPIQEKHTLLERFKANEGDEMIKVLQNKNPQWSDETQSYVLNFHGRVTQASVKNFQIIHASAPEYIVMQFGRISDDEFNMDFKYPMSPIQAFGIAMTSFHGKLACE